METKTQQPVKNDVKLFDPVAYTYQQYSKRLAKTRMPQTISINPSQYVLDEFNPELYFLYVYDLSTMYNFAYMPRYIIEKYNLDTTITRDYNDLKHFDIEKDFQLERIPNTMDGESKYIKYIKNENIRKISTQHFILENISRWLLLDKNDYSHIKGIYKNKDLIPDNLDDNSIVYEIVAKPKIIIRTFYNVQTKAYLAQIARYLYDSDSIQFALYNNNYEYFKKVSTIYIEIKQK